MTEETVDYSCQKRITSEFGSEGLRVPNTVTVVGTGGFGSWAALFAALAGVQKLVLFNPTGKNRHDDGCADVTGREVAIGPFENQHLGQPKVTALTELILSRRPSAKIDPYIKFFEPKDDGDKLEGVVFNGVSNPKVHGKIWECCEVRRLRCYSGFYNGTSFGTLSTYLPEVRVGGDLPVWVGSAVLSAALTVHSAFAGRLSYFGDGRILDTDSAILRLIHALGDVDQ